MLPLERQHRPAAPAVVVRLERLEPTGDTLRHRPRRIPKTATQTAPVELSSGALVQSATRNSAEHVKSLGGRRNGRSRRGRDPTARRGRCTRRSVRRTRDRLLPPFRHFGAVSDASSPSREHASYLCSALVDSHEIGERNPDCGAVSGVPPKKGRALRAPVRIKISEAQSKQSVQPGPWLF